MALRRAVPAVGRALSQRAPTVARSLSAAHVMSRSSPFAHGHTIGTSAVTTQQTRMSSSSSEGADAVLETAPAPGSPFHHAFPVHNLEAAKHFYGTVLGCAEGRSSTKWQVRSSCARLAIKVGDAWQPARYPPPLPSPLPASQPFEKHAGLFS